MAELDEIEVITNAGIPIYYHSNQGKVQDDTALLSAGFFTAIIQYSNELDNGQVKQITMERKDYLLTKGLNYTLIFTSSQVGPEFSATYQPRLDEVREFIDGRLKEVDLGNPGNPRIDEAMDQLDFHLRQLELVAGDDYNAQSFRDGISGLVFRSVGYEPGKCNIGEAERNRRLVYGLAGFTISLLLYATIVLLGLPEMLVFLLVFPNFLGFLGLLQYNAKFCTTNAMKGRYQMV